MTFLTKLAAKVENSTLLTELLRFLRLELEVAAKGVSVIGANGAGKTTSGHLHVYDERLSSVG